MTLCLIVRTRKQMPIFFEDVSMTTPAPESPMPPSPVTNKSNKKLLLIGGGVLAAFVLLLCVCSGFAFIWYHQDNGRQDKGLVGKWKGDAEIIEFRTNGTFISESRVLKRGTYTASGGKQTMTWESSGVKVAVSGTYEISDNHLTLTVGTGLNAPSLKYVRQ